MRLFISYAHEDTAFVGELEKVLHHVAFETWYDRFISPGRKWRPELEEQIRRCDLLLFVLSPDSSESEWCRKEFDFAVDKGKPVVPVKCRHAEIPAYLTEIHCPPHDLSTENSYTQFR